MEKDLRDAYAALKLLRANLVKTRLDKQSLEVALRNLQIHGPPPNAAQIRETQQMQHEDAKSQLWRLAIHYDHRLAEMAKIKGDNKCRKQDSRPVFDGNRHQHGEEVELPLLDKLHSLTATVEQQTQTIWTQQATFLLQKKELKTMVVETQHLLQKEKRKVADAVLEQQAIKEKYAFLETQLDLLKEEKVKLKEEKAQLVLQLAAHAPTSNILKQELEEKEENLLTLKSREKLQCDEETNESVKEARARFRRSAKQLHDEDQRKMLELQRENDLLKWKLKSEKEDKVHAEGDVREPHVRAVGELERHCAELKAQTADSESKRTVDAMKHEEVLKEHAMTVNVLEMKLAEVHKQLAASEASRSTQTQEYEKSLAEALKELQDRRADRDQHEVTLRKLQCDLEAAQTQLEMSEAELAKEVKNNQGVLQQLHDQQHEKERNAITLRDLEIKLSEVQLQLGDSETNHLAQLNEYEEKLMKTSQIAAQHENTIRILALEKKVLQQDIHEAQHTAKLITEELFTCQSVCEEKIQEHMQVEVQCESLETQLLSAEDHREPTKSVHDMPTLEAFHGRTDEEIFAMSALLGSGIKEIDGFLPQLQTVLGAMNDALKLCETHADALPVLCERLQRKEASEKEQLPVLSTALRLLRFAGMLKARTQQEEITVTADFVQSFRKRVLDALAQWYECNAGDDDQGEKRPMPTPTFTTTSRETALILQNWTNDRTKQLGVRRWLARMEAYPGVPPLRGASSNRVLELPPEGCTLELDDMTSEVKDAFLLLVIPILKQNRALHVRVFIRYACNNEVTLKQQQNDEEVGIEKVWSMRIHVQSTVTQARPASFKLSPSSRGSPSPLAPTSPASSVSSSTSSTASSRLQIIQERLQYLHHNV